MASRFLSLPSTLVYVYLPHLVNAQSAWFQQVASPKPSSTVLSEALQCFELPYGGIGFMMHIVAYYIIICFLLGRRPLLPTDRLRNRPWLIAVCSLSFILAAIFSSFAISSCSNNWPFVLLAAWNLVLNIFISVSGMLASFRIGESVPKSMATSITAFFLASCIMGAIGIFSIARQDFANTIVRGLTFALIPILAVVILAAGAIAMTKRFHYREFVSARIVIVVMPSIFLLYSDWILAALQGNWGGVGQFDVRVVYWMNFVALIIPILAF